MKRLTQIFDPELCQLLEESGINFLYFSIRWFLCLLARELPVSALLPLWDRFFFLFISLFLNIFFVISTFLFLLSFPLLFPSFQKKKRYMSYLEVIPNFHTYVCTAFLLRFSSQLRSLSSADIDKISGRTTGFFLSFLFLSLLSL